MPPVRVAVIGAGYWGPNLIRNINELEEAELTVVCDRDPARLDYIRSRFPGIKTTYHCKDIIDSDAEAVIIATPVSTHHRLTMACLSAGKHVLVEKPLAQCSLDGQEMVNAAAAMGKVLMTGHTFLFNPAVVALREIIQSGEIGHIYYVNSTRVNLGLYQPDVNVVWDLAPHDISILLYILGFDPTQISAHGGMYVKPGVHDVAYLSLYFPNSVMAELRVSWLDPVKTRQITVIGSKKMVVYDDIEPVDKLKIYDKGVDVQPYNDTYEEFHLAYRHGDAVPVPLEWQEPLKVECLHFMNSIRNGACTRSDGKQGLKVVKILEAAQKSLFNGGMREDILC